MSEESLPEALPTAGEVVAEIKMQSVQRVWPWTLNVLLLLAVLTVLHLARDLVLPVVAALILTLVFIPAVRAMKRIHISAPLGAGIIVLSLLAAFLGAAYHLTEPAGIWLDKAPQGLREIGTKLSRITDPFREAATATAKVQDMTQKMTGVIQERKVQEVIVQSPTLASGALAMAREFAGSAISTLVLLYFLLASGDLFLRKTIAVTPRIKDRQRAIDIAQQVEAAVSTYLLTVTVINIALGSAVALAMYSLGVPNPVLWGVMVGMFNFVPYLGDIASISVMTIVGLLSFDELWRGLMVPGVFCLLTVVEGYLVTPLIVGKRLSLNPVVIVLSVLFWVWMWGVLGALLAVPILVALKTVLERVDGLQGFAEFLSE